MLALVDHSDCSVSYQELLIVRLEVTNPTGLKTHDSAMQSSKQESPHKGNKTVCLVMLARLALLLGHILLNHTAVLRRLMVSCFKEIDVALLLNTT